MSHPRIVNWNWKQVLPQFFALGFICFVIYLLLPADDKSAAFSLGAISYLVYSISSRQLIPFYHRKGVRLMMKGNYQASIEQFLSSQAFFEQYPWIDRYRSVVLMSPSIFTYREMALMNIAYAYSQLGEARKSEDYYTQVLNEYPANKAARSALALIAAGKQSNQL